MALVTGDPLRENGLVKSNAMVEMPSPVNTVLITEKTYSTTVVDLKWVPRVNLLTHIEGSSWVVNYYSQLIDTDSNLSGQQFTKSAVYQSYTLIKDMEMKVSSPLASAQDAQTKTMTLTGGALLYPFIIPNEGDMFTADIGEGKLGIFRITDSVKKSIFKEACYEITYGLNNDDATTIDDLNTKTVKTYYFHKDFLNYGQNPLLTSNDNDTLNSLYKTYRLLAQQYFKKFFSNEFLTMILPGQKYSIYDHFLVDYLLSEFNTRDSVEIKKLRKLNLDDDDVMKSDSLWNALKLRDVTQMNTVFKTSGLVNARQFTRDPVMEGIFYTGIQMVIYPIEPTINVDLQLLDRQKVLELDNISPSVGGTNTILRSVNLRGTEQSVLDSVYPVTIDAGYVLSMNFYNKTTTQSVLESMVWDYLTYKPIDNTVLLDTAKVYFKWGILEQFYYIPIILTLIRSSIRGF